jgi:hypothetical protein
MKQRTKARTPSKKLALLAESLLLEGNELRSYCSSHGVMLEELLGWRDLALSGLSNADHSVFGERASAHAAEVKALETELRRKNDALAETAALLVLKKKVDAIFGEGK